MADMDKFFLHRANTALVVVDVQERLVKAMKDSVLERLVRNCSRLIKGAGILKVPVVVTEQYPKGLGHTVAELAELASAPAVEKMSFSCCGASAFTDGLAQSGIRNVILTGMEAHVCVYQTMLDLLAKGYRVHLVRDAVCSRNKQDFLAAMNNATAAGAVVATTEMVLFQLLGGADAPEFKEISKLVKEG